MITIQFNNQKKSIAENSSLDAILNSEKINASNFAIAINNIFISKIKHTTTFLKENDIVDIITPMQGG